MQHALLSGVREFLGDLVSLLVRFLGGVYGFLGGALLATLITLLVVGFRARRDRRIASLQEQLQSLYGPVAALSSQNQRLFDLVERIQNAHSRYFAGVEVSENKLRQEATLNAGERTTNLGNLYVRQVIKNNARVMRIIDGNWHLVDALDRDMFSQFQFEYIRYLVESKRGGANGVPMNVILDIGAHEVAFMRPEMMSRVSEAFQNKQKSLENERGRWL